MYTYRPLTAGRIRRRTARAERTPGRSRDIVVHALLVRGGAMTTTVDGDVTRPVEKKRRKPFVVCIRPVAVPSSALAKSFGVDGRL